MDKIKIIDDDISIKTYKNNELISTKMTFDKYGRIIRNSEIGTFTREQCIDKGIDPDKHRYFVVR